MRARRIRREKFLIPAVFAFTMVAVFMTTYYMEVDNGAVAADLSKFDAGKIISDYQMSNSSSMTEDEIQAFLTQKNSCKNKNKALYDEMMERYSPRYTWHFKDDHFVCLSEEKFGDGEVFGEEGTETAAHIIWQAAQDYQINPQVLIVLLQKEQGLITDTYPNSIQYRSATGYGCPDTAACSSKYYGFKNQVRNAAAMFHMVLTGGWTNYPVGKNYVQYNPNPDCGGSEVDIKNRATSALYRYTPYQPSAAALAAGYGTVECGAYGNRNFYLYFEDWFGGILDEDPKVNESEENEGDENEGEEDEIHLATIDERFAQMKKDGVDLGSKIDGEFCYTNQNNNNDYCVQRFKNGYIISGPNGAWESYGEIRTRWSKIGYENGILGYPASGVECETKNGKKYCSQEYDNGFIVTSPSGAWESYGATRERWLELEGGTGVLGYPKDEVYCYKNQKNNNDYCVQRYDNGYIISGPNGAWESYGVTRGRWAELGYENGILGYPKDEVYCYKNQNNGKDYCVQRYDNGYIISGPNGAWESYGVTRGKWAEQHYERGALGYPVGPVLETAEAFTQKYDGGEIRVNK